MDLSKINIDNLKKADYNPRQISEDELLKLSNSIKTFGFVDPIIVNLKNNTIIGGHQRYEVLKKQKNISELYLLKLGDIGWCFPDSELKIDDEDNEKALNLALNKISGEWDYIKLENILIELDDKGYNISLTGFDNLDLSEINIFEDINNEEHNSNKNNPYSQKTNIIQYTPNGEEPNIYELTNEDKKNELMLKIEKSNVTDEQKEFLIKSANRHMIFNYNKIAEYYCHQNEEMQNLMEDLFLVIIDIDDAIEKGYCNLSQEIMELIKRDKNE